jgi:hypothetical protein
MLCYAVKVVLRDDGMGGAILESTSMPVLTLRASSPVRQFMRQSEGNHPRQKGNEKQRRYQYEESLSVKHKILLPES